MTSSSRFQIEEFCPINLVITENRVGNSNGTLLLPARPGVCLSLRASDFRLGPALDPPRGLGSGLALEVLRAIEGLLLLEEALVSRFLAHQLGR